MKKKKIGNLYINYNTDRFISEVLEDKEYGFLNYYPIAIDIGANIGTFSLSMLDHADKIYALEPAQENIDCLMQTIADNHLEKIIPLKMAIGDKSFVQKMLREGDAGGGGWRLDEAGDYPVDVRTLKDFMDSQGIEYADLVKMDTEGWEGRILNTPLFPHKRIGTIIGELHINTAEDVKGLLEYMGFKYMEMNNNHFLARKL